VHGYGHHMGTMFEWLSRVMWLVGKVSYSFSLGQLGDSYDVVAESGLASRQIQPHR
jgi:hypothetical protein